MSTIHPQPTMYPSETVPVSSHSTVPDPPTSMNHAMPTSPSEFQKSTGPVSRNNNPPGSDTRVEEEEQQQQIEASSHSGGFFGALRKRMRSAAGIDSQFVNPYLGKDHSSGKLPPYGQQSSPVNQTTSAMNPPPHPYGEDFYPHQHQQPMMYGMPMSSPPHPFTNGIPMMGAGGGGGGYYGGVPPQFHGPAPFLYPSSSLLDYAYGMHDPYGAAGYPYGGGFNPYSASAMPVQDKRLLPERNHYSAVKDIWSTNLQ